MARNVFFSFHYKPDNWRASQVRNAGVIEGNAPYTDNEWERITRGGHAEIRRWINAQLSGKSCAVVLIGSNTAGRKWITYEIKKAWDDGKGVLGVYIHNLKDRLGYQSTKGSNPFSEFNLNGRPFSGVVHAYDLPYITSTDVYAYITKNIATWVETAISIRNSA